MTSILIKNVLHGTTTTDVLIEGNLITRIAPGISAPAGAEVLDGTDKAIIPGFINTHTHASMTLFRGYGDDLPLMTWLEDYIWPVEAQMTPHDVYVGAKLACLEMLRSGTTCFLDMYMHPLETAKAVEEMGLRAHLSYTLFDQGNPERAALDRKRSYEYMERFGEFSDRITFTLGPHAIYTVSGEQLQFCHQFAVEHGVKIHLHLSETKGEVEECIRLHGLSPVRYLEKLGILSEHLVLAHVVWVDDEEMEKALESGKVARYVTDFPNTKSAKMEKAIVIPHLGASTQESEDNCAVMAANELGDYLENGNIKNSVNFPSCDMGICQVEGRVSLLHQNIPNMIGQITSAFAKNGYNISDLTNKSKGSKAYTLIDIENKASESLINELNSIEGILKVRVIK